MKKRISYSLLIIFAVILLDQYTKYLARTSIYPLEVINILPFLNLVNVHNRGAAFGSFSGLSNSFFIAITIAAILFMLFMIIYGKEDYRIFSLLAGGAAGNLIDRINLGYVVDFIDFFVKDFHWPAFNVADSALTVGIFLMIINLIRRRGLN